ncbi:hypothetical protein I3J27_37810 [Bradyrhizobium xenonodulans]|uniref:Pectinesterase inhibitor domain-containing protein n=1 Tax=Bradyrhizobium xenonodulans TaxID=2736875 RepID=A0ABY7MKE0_9BRAD|nr:hypothetical protein [Bradyrhizobium xenonodulans]WBL78629.1 hypothetical protein I3J27_37810 [Bradyrhizobium xenonodulans]
MISESNMLKSAELGRPGRRRGLMANGVRIIMALVMLLAVPLGTNPAQAGDGGTGAAGAVGSASLEACRTTSGKVLYDCVANALDKMSTTLTKWAPPEAHSALQTAASQLRAASNKAQALSAIAQCRSVFAGLVKQATAAKQQSAPGLSAIVGVLSKAAALIQAKG